MWIIILQVLIEVYPVNCKFVAVIYASIKQVWGFLFLGSDSVKWCTILIPLAAELFMKTLRFSAHCLVCWSLFSFQSSVLKIAKLALEFQIILIFVYHRIFQTVFSVSLKCGFIKVPPSPVAGTILMSLLCSEHL